MAYSSTICMVVMTMTIAVLQLGAIMSTAKVSDHQEFVDAHNKHRADVGVGPLVWNNTLAAYAQKYAESKRSTCEMEHSNGPYGENLSEGFEQVKPADAVNFWASEKKFYDHANNKCVQDECRHYTQVVWKDTTSVGCAKVKCDNNWVFVICNYYPPGNYDGVSAY